VGRALLALLPLASAAGAVLSPWLRVREVKVEGLRGCDGVRVERVAHSLLGRPVLSPALLLAARKLEKEPWVQKVRVSIRLPDTVVLSVEERRAVFWMRSGGRNMALSAEGVAMGWVWGTRGLCRLEGVRPPRKPGDTVEGSEFLALRRLYFALKRAGVGRVEVVGVSERGELFARLENGTVITFGEPVEIERKAERARAVLHFLGSRRARVELLSPDLAIWRPVEGVKGG